MSFDDWEHLGAALLIGPALYSFAQLVRARFAEFRAARTSDEATRENFRRESVRLAGANSLFPLWLMVALGSGLVIQLATLIAKVCGLSP